MKVDFVIGAQYGDEGKGKITHLLCKERPYTHVLRFNGGCNAGHTIYHEGKKFVTHHLPAGLFFGVKSIIGNGCVLDPDQFRSEIKYLEENGVSTDGLIFIAKNAHVILPEHKGEDEGDTAIGTTKRGNGPAYRNKYNRSGTTVAQYAEENEWIRPFVIDLYEELHEGHSPGMEPYVLCEGAQGFGIDIDWGDYPYVTSSHCTTAGALLNAIPPQATNEVWGGAKCYETYVGAKDFHGEDPILEELQNVGGEFGATTGRKRQVNWLNLDFLIKSVRINGLTHLVVNKIDIMREVGEWRLIRNGKTISFSEEGNEEFAEQEFKDYLEQEIRMNCRTVKQILFSESPHEI